MSESPATVAARLVPGAPPPAPAAKSQKKKKSKPGKKSDQPDETVEILDAHAAALIDHAPSEGDVKDGSVAPELIARTTSTRPVSPAGGDEIKLSPIVDMLSKRVKATNKKIVRILSHWLIALSGRLTGAMQTRIQSYSTTPMEKLNDDQLRTLKTLPILEGVVKEIEEVKKVVEVGSHFPSLTRSVLTIP